MDSEDCGCGPARFRLILAITTLYLLAIAVIIAVVIAAATQAWSHEAPMGWNYPALCCSDRDCKPTRDVRETTSGYRLDTTGELVRFGDRRIKDSPDGTFHVCQQSGNFDKGRILCLFVPPMAF